MSSSKQVASAGGDAGAAATARIRNSLEHHLKYTRCKNWGSATDFDKYLSLAYAIRDLAVDKMIATQGAYQDHRVKRVYYLSMEFLLGRLMANNMAALQTDAAVARALAELGLNLESLSRLEPDAGLGNGGLGRLAACFLDSMATLELPAYGYGLRYEHGMFRQELENGWQRERPDDWLKFGYPWEMIRPEYTTAVMVYGRVESVRRARGAPKPVWVDCQVIEGVPYDIPIIGYGVNTVNFLRLWSSRTSEEFRLDVFNQGDYVKAMQQENWAEVVTKVLYPSDNTSAGKELRLIQEYFLVSCSLHDLIRRYAKSHRGWHPFADKNAIQLNDTHPALAVAELMRIFLDEMNLAWETAWDLTTRSLAYTNHTILPEALEKWPVPLLERVLPRHLQIIYEINLRFLQSVSARFPDDGERRRALSLIEESEPKQVRMANLAIVGSHAVNGVSALHTRLLQTQVFPEFHALFPGRFSNKTNGISHRRWLLVCNPLLAGLITEAIGDGWIENPEALRRLEPLAEDPGFQRAFLDVKRGNKLRLITAVRTLTGETMDPDSLFDVHVKRLHEYKRQLLNALHILTLYRRLKTGAGAPGTPRTFLFGAKAPPSYTAAKHILKLITTLAERINNDPDVRDRMRVVFIPDYDVSLAEQIIPAADLSEQISTAGKEASGTGNMKMAMNGALTLGTWDGANIEIAQAVGLEHCFIFGYRANQLKALRPLYRPREVVEADEELRQVLEILRGGALGGDAPGLFGDLAAGLLDRGDYYYLLADYRPYLRAQDKADALYRQPARWARSAIYTLARMGGFSSDRTVREYARDIWRVEPLPIRLDG